ncbi:polysaccharide deacetylase family protein [Phycicoccus sp. Soil748]|uniref:polysaccharide deacetylase family protein n=1 Tax=Phycicoccus sp. Soil748 TaxID=1736397 RepID=UPI0021007E90|nr:polysaccharide deacetylase family protein [Phycicoccus sp. Soil748]
MPPALRDGVVTRLPTSSRVVALTFDGGAGSQGAATILATLRAQGVPASFFVTGKFAAANPSTTRQMAAVGPVGNHTWSHPDLTTVGSSTLQQELSFTRSAILAATGKDPRPLFRFPFGAYDSRVLGLVHAQGYGAVGWTTDSLGWKGTSGGMTVDSVVARVLAGRTPGQVVLMHVGANPDDGTTFDAAALPRIIAGYRAAGYGFTTLTVLTH